jgi:hypothetical protein
LIETNSALVYNIAGDGPLALGTNFSAGTSAYVSPSVDGYVAVTARFQVYLDAPTTAGTYVVRLVPTNKSNGGVTNAASLTLTITVGSASPTPEPSPSPTPTDISQMTAPLETSTPETYTTSINVSRTLAGQLTSKNQMENEVLVNLKLRATNLADTATVQAVLVSSPASSTSVPVLEFIQVTNGNVNTVTPALTSIPPGITKTNNPFYLAGGTNPVIAQAQFRLYMNSPKVAGVYVVKIITGIAGGPGSAPAGGVNIVILVSKDPQTYPTRAEVIVSKPGEISNKSDAIIYAPTSFDFTTEVAVIRTTMKTLNGSTSVLDSYTAVITGPGLIGSAPLSADINTSAIGRAITVRAGDAVTVYADGNSGVATIMILTFDGTEVARKTVNFVDLTNQASAILALSFSSFPEKGTPMQLTALVNLPGTVRFTTNGKTLGSCARVTATGSPKTAICQWKPPLAGSINVVARFTPTDTQITPVSTTKVLAIGRRSGRR